MATPEAVSIFLVAKREETSELELRPEPPAAHASNQAAGSKLPAPSEKMADPELPPSPKLAGKPRLLFGLELVEEPGRAPRFKDVSYNDQSTSSMKSCVMPNHGTRRSRSYSMHQGS